METLKWYRSYPAPEEIAEKKLETVPHIVDNLPRLLMTQYNMQRVEWPQDEIGFCMLEWDIALDPIERRQFAAEALIEPREILVAPYRFHNTWVTWHGNDGGGPTFESRPTPSGCEHCGMDRTDSFGLGCIYFPQDVLQEFLKQMDGFGFTDYTFGKWYREKYGQARVTWRVHPQHLHEYAELQ